MKKYRIHNRALVHSKFNHFMVQSNKFNHVRVIKHTMINIGAPSESIKVLLVNICAFTSALESQTGPIMARLGPVWDYLLLDWTQSGQIGSSLG